MVPGGNIFALNKLYIPVNVNAGTHWILIMVFFDAKKTIRTYDALGPTETRRSYVEYVFQYLQDEHKRYYKIPMPDLKSWRLRGSAPLSIPMQLNGYNCGVFVCVFVDSLLRGATHRVPVLDGMIPPAGISAYNETSSAKPPSASLSDLFCMCLFPWFKRLPAACCRLGVPYKPPLQVSTGKRC